MTDVLSSHPPLPRSWCGGVVLGVKRFGVHVLVLVPFFMFGVHVLVLVCWSMCWYHRTHLHAAHALASSHALACSARTHLHAAHLHAAHRTCMQRTHLHAAHTYAIAHVHVHTHATAFSTHAHNTRTRTYATSRIFVLECFLESRFVLCVSDALCFDAVRGP